MADESGNNEPQGGGMPAPPPPPLGNVVPSVPPVLTEPLRPLRELGRASRIGVIVVLAIDALVAVSFFNRRAFLVNLNNGDDVNFADLDSADNFVAVASILWLIAWLVTGVIFIVWFHRAYKNLQTLGRTKHKAGWAIGAWFVPFLNFWRPGKMMEELLGDDDPAGSTWSSQLWIWWWLWVASSLVDRVIARSEADTLDGLITLETVGIANTVANVLAGVLLLGLISRVTTLQDDRPPT